MDKPSFVLLAFVALLFRGDEVAALSASYVCMEPPTGVAADFRLILRVDTSTVGAATGLTAYERSVFPTTKTAITEAGCNQATAVSGVYEVDVNIEDGGTLDCGVQDATGGVFNIAYRIDGTETYYTFSCDTNALVSNTVSPGAALATNSVQANKMTRFNPTNVDFQLVEADGPQTPVGDTVELGQNVKFRLIYNQGFIETGPTNWGTTFHTAFGPAPAGSTLYLEIVTPGLGARVHITGTGGTAVDEWVTVKRDEAVKFMLPDTYDDVPGLTDTAWQLDTRGVKIESQCDTAPLCDRIGVRVVGESPDDVASFAVLPDTSLGQDYRLTGLGGISSQIMIVGTQDATVVTVKSNLLGVTIDGNILTSPSLDVTINENQVITIQCTYNDCVTMSISATNPVAVVASAASGSFDGTNPQANTGVTGYFAEQLLPAFAEGKHFIVTGDPFVFIQETPAMNTFTFDVSSTYQATSPMWEPTSTNFRAPPFEVTTDNNGAMYFPFATNKPDVVHCPSVGQWSNRYHFYARQTVVYELYIVVEKGKTASIQTSPAITLGTTTDIVPIGSGAVLYEMSATPYTHSSTDQLIEVKYDKPFMLILAEKSGGNLVNSYLPYGVRYPNLQASGCTAQTLLGTFDAFGIPIASKPGDLIDNDCDGKVDEEFNNGKDDDGDGEVDEDLALVELQATGIYVESLKMATDAAFTTNAYDVITTGCNQNAAVLDSIGDFVKNTALSTDFNEYWVLDSDIFDAFSFANNEVLYFRVTYGFCYLPSDMAGKCAQSCQTSPGRKRRENDVDEDLRTIDLQLHVTSDGKKTLKTLYNQHGDAARASNGTRKAERQAVHPCETNPFFWMSATLLVSAVIVEIGAIVWMTSLKRAHAS